MSNLISAKARSHLKNKVLLKEQHQHAFPLIERHIMPPDAFIISLSGLSDRDQEKAAAELARTIEQSDQTIIVERRQDNAVAMDFGATLAVILGSGTAVAVARGIQRWMGRWNDAELTLRDKDRKIEIKRMSSHDVARIVEAFLSPPKAE